MCLFYFFQDKFFGRFFGVENNKDVINISCVIPDLLFFIQCFIIRFVKYCRNISAVVLDIGNPMATPLLCP